MPEPAKYQIHYNTIKIYLLALNTMVSGFLVGYNSGVFNTCMVNVSYALEWGDNHLAYIALCSALVPAGAFFGGLSSSYLGSRYGRRKSIILSDLLGILAAGITIIPDTLPFAIGRFLSGIMIGLSSSVASTYMSEISPKEIRGKTGGFFQLLRMAGLVVAYVLGLPLPVDNLDDPMNDWWIVMFVFPCIANLIQGVIFLTVFKLESPYWLVSHGKEEQTHVVLSSIYIDKETEQAVFEEIVSFQEDSIGKELEGSIWKKIKVLFFTPKFRKMVRIACLFGFLQPMTGYTAVISYSTMLFTEISGDIFLARQYTVILGISGIVGAIIMLQLIERVGRKKLLLYGLLVMTVAELTNASFLTVKIPTYIPTMIMVYIFMVAFSISIGPITLIYVSEITMHQIVALCVAMYWLGAVTSVICAPYMIKYLGVGVMFFIFGGITLASLIYFWFDIFETKGLTKEQIREIVLGPSYREPIQSNSSTNVDRAIKIEIEL